MSTDQRTQYTYAASDEGILPFKTDYGTSLALLTLKCALPLDSFSWALQLSKLRLHPDRASPRVILFHKDFNYFVKNLGRCPV